MIEGKVRQTPSDITPSSNPTTFKKGQSGNPKGRPKGAKNIATLVKQAVMTDCENILLRDIPRILKQMVDTALGGDAEMQKFLLNKFMPNAAIPQAGQGKQAITAINITVSKGDEPSVSIEGKTLEEQTITEGE